MSCKWKGLLGAGVSIGWGAWWQYHFCGGEEGKDWGWDDDDDHHLRVFFFYYYYSASWVVHANCFFFFLSLPFIICHLGPMLLHLEAADWCCKYDDESAPRGEISHYKSMFKSVFSKGESSIPLFPSKGREEIFNQIKFPTQKWIFLFVGCIIATDCGPLRTKKSWHYCFKFISHSLESK